MISSTWVELQDSILRNLSMMSFDSRLGAASVSVYPVLMSPVALAIIALTFAHHNVLFALRLQPEAID